MRHAFDGIGKEASVNTGMPLTRDGVDVLPVVSVNTSIIASFLSGRDGSDKVGGAKETAPETLNQNMANHPDPKQHLFDDIATKVAAGFDTREEIVEQSIEAVEDENLTISHDKIVQLVDDAIAAHAAVEATWTGMTDNDRLDAAATRLENAEWREWRRSAGAAAAEKVYAERGMQGFLALALMEEADLFEVVS